MAKEKLIKEVDKLIDSVPVFVNSNKSDFKLYFGTDDFDTLKSRIFGGKYKGYEIILDKNIPNNLFFIK